MTTCRPRLPTPFKSLMAESPPKKQAPKAISPKSSNVLIRTPTKQSPFSQSELNCCPNQYRASKSNLRKKSTSRTSSSSSNKTYPILKTRSMKQKPTWSKTSSPCGKSYKTSQKSTSKFQSQTESHGGTVMTSSNSSKAIAHKTKPRQGTFSLASKS